MIRPPPVLVDDTDDAPIRHDINSEDIRRTYPDLPYGGDRNSFVTRCDHEAYRTIRHLFPEFRPQCTREPPPKQTCMAPLFHGAVSQPAPEAVGQKQR